MKNDQLTAAYIILDCLICRTYSKKENISLYSEKIGHFLCHQCGYEVLEVTFRFENTNIGICLQQKTSEETLYTKPVYIFPYTIYNVTYQTPAAELRFCILGQ